MKQKLFLIIAVMYSIISFAQIELVKDINEGDKDSSATNFITYKNEVYFTASQNFSNYLFKYVNGNVEKVKDQDNNEVKPSTKPLEFNGILYLSARINNVHGVYSFDGANFTLLAETYFYLPKVLNDKIFFYAQYNSSNFTLWVTDGTVENTKEFLDLQVYSFLGTGYESAVAGDKLFFVAKNAESGRELWVTNGSTSGTKLVKDINQGTSSSDPKGFFVASNGNLYFTAKTDDNGRELYVTDGTENGTFMLKDFYTGTAGGDFYIEELNNTIFINKKGGSTDVLFISDGTIAGTNPIDSSIKSKKLITAYNGLVYFEGSISGQNENLIVSDGTLSGTKVLKSNLDYESLEMFPFNNNLYFRGNEDGKVELWKTDGTESGTTKVIDLDNNSALDGSFPANFTVFNNELIFEATQFGVTGTELWKTDGTEAGTQLIQDLSAGSSSTKFFEFYVTNNVLLINLEESNQLGRELYKYESSTADVTSNFLDDVFIYSSSDVINIKGLKTQKSILKIIDLTGKEIKRVQFVSNGSTEVATNLKTGVYIINIITERGKSTSKKIFIK